MNKIEVLRSSISRDFELSQEKLIAVVSDFDVDVDIPRFNHDQISEIVEFMEKL